MLTRGPIFPSLLTLAAAGGTMLAVSLSGCMSGAEVIAADVPPEGWRNSVELVYHNTDTLNVSNLTLSLRHSAEVLPTENGFLVKRLSPWGDISVDTVRLDIPAIVSRTGRLHETTAGAGSRVRFDQPGEWRFTVTPLQDIHGAWSVAIELNR